MPVSELLTHLLRDVSRSFHLTLRILPAAIRTQIGLAYLLARTTDTIADTPIVPVHRRVQALQQLRAAIQAASGDRLQLNEFLAPESGPPQHPTPAESGRTVASKTAKAERLLLQRVGETIALLNTLDPDDRGRIRDVLEVITSGQELDLIRFSACSPERIVALDTNADLDDYTYRVAGCVGEFWTHICRAHLFPLVPLDTDFLLRTGVRFGKGLQLVNILRDLPRDLRQGRCYVPLEVLRGARLLPSHLLDPQNESRAKPILQPYIALAHAHLSAGWAYTNHLPWRSARIRLACAWPVLIGVKTLAKIQQSGFLGHETPVKITRSELRRILTISILSYPVPAFWKRLFRFYSGGLDGLEEKEEEQIGWHDQTKSSR